MQHDLGKEAYQASHAVIEYSLNRHSILDSQPGYNSCVVTYNANIDDGKPLSVEYRQHASFMSCRYTTKLSILQYSTHGLSTLTKYRTEAISATVHRMLIEP